MLDRLDQQTKRILLAVLALVLIAGSAWALDLTARKKSERYEVSVTSGDDVLATFSLEDLKAMEARRVLMQGQLQEGPALLDVLAAAGVEDFNSVMIYGMGLRDEGQITLSRAEISEEVLLDFAARGTVKLCGPDIAWADRVRDVERLDVR
ncbi:MAG: hypothetical protein RBS78_05135 [Coriobacteriia bacterium]|jgi:hypothetical protein|nr:hypothetical protein [Coriobacteriia bacterium]